MLDEFDSTTTSALRNDIIPSLNTKGGSNYVLSRLHSAHKQGNLPSDMSSALLGGSKLVSPPRLIQKHHQLRLPSRRGINVKPPKNGIQFNPKEAICEYLDCDAKTKNLNIWIEKNTYIVQDAHSIVMSDSIRKTTPIPSLGSSEVVALLSLPLIILCN